MAYLTVHHLIYRRCEEELDADGDGIFDHAVALHAGVFFRCEEDRICICLSNRSIKFLLSSDIIGLQFGDDMSYIALSVLEETYYVIMRRVLQSRNESDRLYADTIDKDVLAFLSAFHLALDHVICEKHCYSEYEECCTGHEEVCKKQNVEADSVVNCQCIYNTHHNLLAESHKDEASELTDCHMADDDTIGTESPYEEKG